MSIEQKVQLVENLFKDLEKESIQFEKSSGLSCVAGCGKCCTHPDIEASPLEFFPWAFHLFLQGEAENTLKLLADTKSSTCFIYQPLAFVDKGNCSTYKNRGLICRLFGFSANTDKYGKLRLATCKIIKEGQAEKYETINASINQGLKVPIFTEYYMRLSQIDFRLGNRIMPVNQALKLALEEVLRYYEYRNSPDVEIEVV
jgi:Fe-S-cluster containining protein